MRPASCCGRGCQLSLASSRYRVLIEPFIIRRQVPARLWGGARQGTTAAAESGGIASKGPRRVAPWPVTGLTARARQVSARRDALAIILVAALWFTGFYLRPDYWWNLPNTFAILLNFTEVALLTIGLTYVIACGDIDLSVGAVLALAGSTAAYCVKALGMDPMAAVAMGMLAGTSAGVVNGLLTVSFGLPSFIATLGMYYIARGLAAWVVAGSNYGVPEKLNLYGRKIADIFATTELNCRWEHARLCRGGECANSMDSACRIIAGMFWLHPFGQRI